MELLLTIKLGQIQIRWLGDLNVPLGAEDDVDFFAEAFDEAGFVRGGDAVGLRAGEGFFQELRGKNLRRLREDNAFARDRHCDERYVFGEACALYFFYGVHRWNSQNCRAAVSRFFDNTRNLFTRDEWPDGIMNEHDFSSFGYVLERRGNRLLTGVAAFYHAQRLPKFVRVQSFGKADHFFGASRDDNLGDQLAGRNFPQAVDENWRAIQLQKLFGRFRAHARAESRGGQDCCNFAHECAANRRLCRLPANTTVYLKDGTGKTRSHRSTAAGIPVSAESFSTARRGVPAGRRGKIGAFVKPAKDHFAGRSLMHGGDRDIDIAVGELARAVDDDHCAIFQIGDALIRFFALAQNQNPHRLARQNRGPQRVCKLVDVQHGNSLQAGHFVQIEIIGDNLRSGFPRQFHEAPVHFSIRQAVLLEDFYLYVRHFLHALQNFQPATAALAAQRV